MIPDINRELALRPVYQTDGQGVFVGTTYARESPLEPGVFLIPAGCVEVAPPSFTAGQVARWSAGAWQVEDAPASAAPAPAPIEPTLEQVTEMIAALQAIARSLEGDS